MLSYQHIYHAGNLADVHKHTLLAWMLAYLTRKEKPLSYIETHAGRALYDLGDPAAVKTTEAAQGIESKNAFFPEDHPLAHVLTSVKSHHGPRAYAGSPLLAATLLRPSDRMHLAELHPAEYDTLRHVMASYPAKCYRRDGIELAHSLCPPTPRRGLMLIDPSYEIKQDYKDLPAHIRGYAKAWNVGVIALWYPILKVSAHRAMLDTLQQQFPDALRHEVTFPPARAGHGMIGSGIFVINPPFGLTEEAARLADVYKSL